MRAHAEPVDSDGCMAYKVAGARFGKGNQSLLIAGLTLEDIVKKGACNEIYKRKDASSR